MIKNILLVFFRKIFRKDVYSVINLFGLSIGIAACLLIFLYVVDELRFDRHHEHAENVYRIIMENRRTGSYLSLHPAVMKSTLDGRVPGVEHIARYFPLPDVTTYAGRDPITEHAFVATDGSILDILTLEFVHGNPETAFSAPNSAIVTRETAQRYFGDDHPIGKIITVENEINYTVTAVIEPLPPQSHIHFNILADIEGFRTYLPSAFTDWANLSSSLYVRLHPAADPKATETFITELIWDAQPGFKDNVYFPLQPMLDIRLRSQNIEWDTANVGNQTTVIIFGAIALMILVLACFNFVNLSVALAVRRSKEIGIKKILGAGRAKLIGQFIAETFVMVSLAMILAWIFAELFLPVMGYLTGKNLQLSLFNDTWNVVFLISTIVLISVLAGLYPALVVSRFKAVDTLKGAPVFANIKSPGNKRFQFGIRQILMILQFAVSTALIVSSLMVFLQMQFLSNRSAGYEREGLMVLTNPYDSNSASRANWLKNELMQNPSISMVGLGHNVPPGYPTNYSRFAYATESGDETFHSALISVDENYFSTLGAKIIQGRDFSSDYALDAGTATIINATAAARMGLDDPTGANLRGFYDNQARRIIGVIEDIHFASMHETVEPMVFFMESQAYPQNWFNLVIRYTSDDADVILAHIHELWHEVAPQWPIQYYFPEQKFMEDYHDDRRSMLLLSSFASLAIVLSLLGLFGLALYSTGARTREIGIRKVLGASLKSITGMIASDFGILVIISNIIAWPAAYLFLSRWLEQFAYRIDIQWTIFLMSAVFVFLIATATVWIIAYKAAKENPVKALQQAD